MLLEISIHYNDQILSVAAGGTLRNNTYNWYKDGVLDTIIKGDNTYKPNETGTYYVIVENRIATKLKLKSEPIDIHTLPISILDFKCTQHSSTVLLQWQAFEEESTIGFNIQRSTDAIHYTTIGKVKAKKSSNALANHIYVDETTTTINAEKLFYRLEIVDQNQRKQLSKVISIILQKENKTFTIYPNPASDYIDLRSQYFLQKNIHMQIFDLAGRKVKEKKLSNEVNQKLLITELNGGLYNVVLYDDHQIIYKIPLLIK